MQRRKRGKAKKSDGERKRRANSGTVPQGKHDLRQMCIDWPWLESHLWLFLREARCCYRVGSARHLKPDRFFFFCRCCPACPVTRLGDWIPTLRRRRYLRRWHLGRWKARRSATATSAPFAHCLESAKMSTEPRAIFFAGDSLFLFFLFFITASCKYGGFQRRLRQPFSGCDVLERLLLLRARLRTGVS